MISYFKQRVSYYKIDTEGSYFQQVNKANDSYSIGKITNSLVLQGICKSTSENAGGEWEVITEEQFNQVKLEVFTVLSAV